MKTCLFLMSFMSLNAFANTQGYWVAVEVYKNGEKVFSPQFLVEEAKSGQVIEKSKDQENSMEVVAQKGAIQNRKGILLSMKLALKASGVQASEVSKPQFLLQDGEQAEMTVQQFGKDEIKIKAFVVSQDFPEAPKEELSVE